MASDDEEDMVDDGKRPSPPPRAPPLLRLSQEGEDETYHLRLIRNEVSRERREGDH